MNQYLTVKNAVIVLVFLCIVQFGLLASVWNKQDDLTQQNTQQFNTLEQSLQTANNGVSYQQVTVSPSDNRIYLPQLSLFIPLTAPGTALVYSPNTAYVTGSNTTPTGPNDEANISTFATINTPQTQTQFDCSELVRIKFDAKPNPYNPHEIPSGSVTLANGKTLQIYANHLKNCRAQWLMAGANPDAIAALFTQTQSY